MEEKQAWPRGDGDGGDAGLRAAHPVQALSRPYLGQVSATSWPYLGQISGRSRADLG